MLKITQLITHFGPRLQLFVFIILFIILWNIENIAGFFIGYKKWNHFILNLPFILTDLPIQIIMSIFFVHTINWTHSNNFGIVNLLHLNSHFILVFIFSFILLDFGEYIYHVTMHKIKKFWKFHIVHHSDQILDVSTTLREHPGETLIRLLFTLLWVFLGGISFWALMLRQLIQAIATPIVHMNYRLPEKADKFISLVFITPNLHHVHHHYKLPYTDSNYGDVLSIWDRIFGTLKKMPSDMLTFGVDTHFETEVISNFRKLILLPFSKIFSNKIEKISQ
jgi:sterol desaturase/sphingolipid hydroxylase (fatty acid hydroxylase superfamily)